MRAHWSTSFLHTSTIILRIAWQVAAQGVRSCWGIHCRRNGEQRAKPYLRTSFLYSSPLSFEMMVMERVSEALRRTGRSARLFRAREDIIVVDESLCNQKEWAAAIRRCLRSEDDGFSFLIMDNLISCKKVLKRERPYVSTSILYEKITSILCQKFTRLVIQRYAP